MLFLSFLLQTNADVEWKFSRAVVAEEYRRCHPIIIPFNILTVPIASWYIRRYGDMRERVSQFYSYIVCQLVNFSGIHHSVICSWLRKCKSPSDKLWRIESQIKTYSWGWLLFRRPSISASLLWILLKGIWWLSTSRLYLFFSLVVPTITVSLYYQGCSQGGPGVPVTPPFASLF